MEPGSEEPGDLREVQGEAVATAKGFNGAGLRRAR